MNDSVHRPLVNFRVSLGLINAFDDACRLADSTRTDILIRLMKSYIETSANQMPKQLAEERRSIKTLRAAVERAEQRKRAVEPKPAGSTFRQRPRKSFAEFVADDPIMGKRA